jgi:hypothetical protein
MWWRVDLLWRVVSGDGLSRHPENLRTQLLLCAVTSTTWSMRGRGNRSFGHSIFRIMLSPHIVHFSFFFGTRTRFAIQSWCWTSLMKPTIKSFTNSSHMALCFSSLKRRRPCLTGLDPGLMSRVCSAISQETLIMSVDLHTKMSLLHRRKLTNSPSPFGLKPAPA